MCSMLQIRKSWPHDEKLDMLKWLLSLMRFMELNFYSVKIKSRFPLVI